MAGDRYALITEDEGMAVLAKQDDERNPCTREWLTFSRGAVKVTLGVDSRVVVGVADCDVQYIGSVVDSVTGVKNTACHIEVYPLDIRKKLESYIEVLRDAVRKAMEQ